MAMSEQWTRRSFVKGALIGSAGLALGNEVPMGGAGAAEQPAPANPAQPPAPPPQAKEQVPKGKLGHLQIGRLLLGGNLLTHFTHSRDLRYVYTLTQHYNTKEKIFETMALAEAHGINALVIHTAPGVLEMLKEYRQQRGGKMHWIICPTAEMKPGLQEFKEQVAKMIDFGTDAIYIWGVRADALVAQGEAELIGQAVELVKARGLLCGVGAHDLRVVQECERLKVPADFYIKTLHHHQYPTGPKPEQITGPTAEIPGYWCSHPKETIEFMEKVEKPWIAFKVMAAGAIPPANAFRYALRGGADFILAGMFDFEIADDVRIFNQILAENPKRSRPWRA
jgi:hypothetical protein